MVWENVPGAFSSNKGEDFRVVLEETARIVDKNAVIPLPTERWTPSGCILGEGWSIAWRVHDAQFWGVPQRRKRISLVADFGGESAPEILFERESMSGNTEPSEQEGEETTRTVGKDLAETGGQHSDLRGNRADDSERRDTTSFTLKIRGGVEIDSKGKKAGKGALVQTELSGTLGVSQDQTLITNCMNAWDVQSKHIQPEDGKAEALYSGECRGGGGESYVMQGINGETAETLDASYYKGCGERQGIERTVVYGMSAYDSNAMKSSNPESGIYEADTTRTLDNNGGNPACNQGGMIVLEGNGSRDSHRGDGYKESEISYSLNTVEQHAVCVGNGQSASLGMDDVVGTLDCMHEQQMVMAFSDVADSLMARDGRSGFHSQKLDRPEENCVVYGIDRASFNQGQNAQYDFSVEEEKAQTIVAKGPGGGADETVGALCARDYKGVGSQYVDEGKCIIQHSRPSNSEDR